ncbi:hypothetical protein [Microbulbifer sp. TYP-18]|uniref:hypothetical protein n=1 Tax=Microbulbifer sp. TYP-18 TaxID=3230024 RepID=UPI0034C63F03
MAKIILLITLFSSVYAIGETVGNEYNEGSPYRLSYADETDRESSANKVVENAVGRIILTADAYSRYDYSETNPFGVAKAFIMFRDIYEQEIRQLAPRLRTDFIWSVMWHLDLAGGYLTEFIEIISEDDTSFFENKLKRYIAIEEKLLRHRTKLTKSKIILHGLMNANK